MRILLVVGTILLSGLAQVAANPIQLHPGNPHYFLYHGESLILITSAEHYGAVLNSDFDCLKYLNTLVEDGMNYTRIFTGTYFEKPGAFGIEKNTLAPAPGKALTPWARSDVPGNLGGGNKFDLDRWNPEYFSRLKAFVSAAAARSIIVEVTLFSSIYSDSNWDVNPLNPANNINNTGHIDRIKVHTLDNWKLLEYQRQFVRKIVSELNIFDNVFFEVQNEPYGDLKEISLVLNPYDSESKEHWMKRVDMATSESLRWQRMVVSVIKDEEERLPKRHLIAQNYCNFRCPLKEIDRRVSILNFHYAWPEAVSLNYGYERLIGFDESGFSGKDDATYRRQAWRFIMAGGGLFNNLDYSFTVGNEDGTAINDAPGGGGSQLRSYLKVLKEFITGFDFVQMRPSNDIVIHAPGTTPFVLANPGHEYAVYLDGGEQCGLELRIAPGKYRAEWVDIATGKNLHSGSVNSRGTPLLFASPPYQQGIALRIIRLN
jgi:hypothetical protein